MTSQEHASCPGDDIFEEIWVEMRHHMPMGITQEMVFAAIVRNIYAICLKYDEPLSEYNWPTHTRDMLTIGGATKIFLKHIMK